VKGQRGFRFRSPTSLKESFFGFFKITENLPTSFSDTVLVPFLVNVEESSSTILPKLL
jgi:hypothetical protein